MRALLFYVAFSCLIMLQAKGQDTDGILKKEKIIRDSLKLLKGKVSCKPISAYQADLSKISATTIDKKIAADLIFVTKKFIEGCNIKKQDSCGGKAITNLVSTAGNWKMALLKYIGITAASPKKDTVKIKNDTAKIKFIVSGIFNDTSLTTTIKLDATHTAPGFLKMVGDGKGSFTLYLLDPKKITGTSKGNAAAKFTFPAKASAPNIPANADYSIAGFIHEQKGLSIMIVIFFLGCVAVILYLVNRIKGLSELEFQPEEIAPLPEEIPIVPVPAIIPEPVIRIEPMQHLSSTNRYFDCEIMMTAGPRKKFMSEPDADFDLGEDICGFKIRNESVLLWLMDGTSDMHAAKHPVTHQDYFSSRLLAQSVAANLKQYAGEISADTMGQIVTQAIEQARLDWLIAINALPDSEKTVLKNNIETNKFLECATTMLIARLDIDGQLIAYRSGDSKMFLYKLGEQHLEFLPSSLDNKNDESNDRIFFRLINTEDGFDILFNNPLFEVIHTESVQAIIGCSDGIGRLTEQLLKQGYANDKAVTRADIARQVQGTADDKSLCIIEIKEG